ncbi:DeoR/GlpR family DNA-binding transcription regulator [Sporosalibacterium faouarense]|uniref:DeoR/GlpR family DNA-binding transcription regulator n=1 Tax=Sporosalibacterium faouarense TaxID=516123 RepID=UPI00141D4D98|nr:DeoR/GlpR family DNA-binding transcription regulator [Sporosalibacterium faouarense]MTI47345.1 DeoR/GlpR transcriptional regulator [Bacillota bacterium]
MLQAERRNYIINLMRKNGKVIVEDLASELGVSTMTIRRDLKYLEDNNLLTRTHGGAVSNVNQEIPYSEKADSANEEKEKIAEYAATLVEEGSTIILDAGTTTMEIAKKIKDKKNITVITTDIMIGAFLSKAKGIKVFCTGGVIQSETGACIGTKAEEFLEDIYADITFLGTSAIDLKKGVTTPNLEKSRLKRTMMSSSDEVILVLDSSKFGKKSFSKVCGLDEIDLIITDENLHEDTVSEIKDKEIPIELV